MKTPHESDKPPNRGRRDFLKVGGVSVAANLAYTALPPGVNAESTDKSSILPSQAVQEMMPTRNLGKTRFRVGIFGLGGQGALEKANDGAVAVAIIQKALELGDHHFVTSAI